MPIACHACLPLETKRPCRARVLCSSLAPRQRTRGPSACHSSRHYLRDNLRTFGALRSDRRCPVWRPSRLPRALAAAMPDLMRSRIRSRSNSASAAITEAIILPCGVDRSNCRPETARTDTSHTCSDCTRSMVLRPHRDSSVIRMASISRACAQQSAAHLRHQLQVAVLLHCLD